MIEWQCRQCGEALEAPDSLEGHLVDCPRCGTACRAPARAETTATSIDARPFQLRRHSSRRVCLILTAIALLLVVIPLGLFWLLQDRTIYPTSAPTQTPPPADGTELAIEDDGDPYSTIDSDDSLDSVLINVEAEPAKSHLITGSFGREIVIGDLLVNVNVAEVRQAGLSFEERRELIEGTYVPIPKPWLTRVKVSVMNPSETRKISFHTWRGSGPRDFGARLTDNLGNEYMLEPSWGSLLALEGEVSLYPGTMIIDEIVFEPLIDSIEWLELSLPCGNAGTDGEMKVRISRENIEWHR